MTLQFPDDLRCTETTQKGTRCTRGRKRGTKWCEKHQPKREEVIVGDIEVADTIEGQIARHDAVEVVRGAGVEVMDPNHLEPVEVMSYAVKVTNRIVVALERRLHAAENIAADSEASAVRSILDAVNGMIKAATAAESAGMQRRKMMLHEAQVQTMFVAASRAIQRMDLSDLEEQRFQSLFAEELRSVQAAA